jgi:NAD(P)H dehydrogenase (quinone)
VAAILSEIAGKTIPYVPLSPADLVQAMVQKGLSEFLARVFVSFDEAMAQGYMDIVTDDLKTLTGRPGQSVREFLMAHKAALLTPPRG